MAKRVYWVSVLKWAAKIGLPIAGGVSVFFIFSFLIASGAIEVTGFSGDTICAGTLEDPCIAIMNFTAKEDVFIYPMNYDPWGRETPFEVDQELDGWKMYRSWGTGWREIDLNNSCTGTWCGAPNNQGTQKYSIAFRKGRNYTIKLEVLKKNEKQSIKWGFGDLDPYFLGIENQVEEYSENEMVFTLSDKTYGVEILNAELKSHEDVNEIKNYGVGPHVVMFYDFYSINGLMDALGTPKFTDIKTGNLVEREWRYVVWKNMILEEPVYTCDKIAYLNGTFYDNNCIQTGTKPVIYETWSPYNTKDIPKGEIRIGIEVDNKEGDYIDGIWKVGGIEIEKHAGWVASLNTDLLGYWSLEDDLADTVVEDQLGTTDGSLEGGDNTQDVNIAAKINDGFNLNGVDDYVDIGNSLNAQIAGGDFSVSLWVKSDTGLTGGAYEAFHWNEGGAPNNGYRLHWVGSNFYFALIQGVGWESATWAQDMIIGTWYHIVGTYDYSTRTGTLWVNGTARDTVVTTFDFDVIEGTNIFGAHAAGEQQFDGVEDEIGEWDRILTDPEIAALWNDGNGLEFNVTAQLVVTLLYPEDVANLTSNSISFISNVSDADGIGITNTTISVWNTDNDTLAYSSTNSSGFDGNYTFPTTLADGNFNLSAIAYGDDVAIYNSSTRTFEIDSTTPLIAYDPTTPSNGSYLNTAYVLVNVSATDTNLDSVVLNWNGTNETFDNNVGDYYWENQTGLSELTYTFLAFANDTFGHANQTEERTVTIDTITPLIQFISPTPTNNTIVGGVVDYIFANLSITEINIENVTYTLFNSTSQVNQTTYTSKISQINWTGLPDESYYYNATIYDLASTVNSTETRIYHISTLRIFFEEVEGNNTAELGSLNLIANSTALELEICVDIEHPKYGSDAFCGIGEINESFDIEYFRRIIFSNDSESNQLIFDEVNVTSDFSVINFSVTAHQYDYVVNLSLNISGEVDEGNSTLYEPQIIFYKPDNPTQIDRAFYGTLNGSNIYIDKVFDNSNGTDLYLNETNVSFQSVGDQLVYFYLDENADMVSFTLNLTGYEYGVTYDSGATYFEDYDDIDRVLTTGHLDDSGRILAKNTSKVTSYYDTYNSVLDPTLWNTSISNVATGSVTETGSYIETNIAYLLDGAFSGHVAWVYPNWTQLNLYTSNNLTFRVVSDYDAQENNGDSVTAYSRVHLGYGGGSAYVIWTSNILDSGTDNSNEQSDADLNFQLDKYNQTDWRVQITGVETSTQNEYGGCNDNDASGTWNWTNGSYSITCNNPGDGGPWNGDLDNDFYNPVTYSTDYAILVESLATKQNEARITNTKTRLYAVQRDLYSRSNATVISKSIYNSDVDILSVTPYAFAGSYGGDAVYLYLSADDGENWESATSGVEHSFTNLGTNLKWRADINLSATGYNPRATRLIRVNLTTAKSYPTNVSLDFGNNGTFDYTMSGNLTSEVNVTLTNADFSGAFTGSPTIGRTWLVPLRVYSDSAGTVQIDNIDLLYNPNPVYLNTTSISSYLENIENLQDLNISIGAVNGTLNLTDLRYDYRGGNDTIKFNLTDGTLLSKFQLIYYYSRFIDALPYDWTDYIFFLPRTNSSKNVSAYGQTSTTPILNITNLGYGGLAENLSFHIDYPSVCLDLTISTNNSKLDGYFIGSNYNDTINSFNPEARRIWEDGANDSAGNGHNYDAQIGAPTFVDSIIPNAPSVQALLVNGQTEGYKYPDSVKFNTYTDPAGVFFAAIGWINITSAPSGEGNIIYEQGGGTNSLSVYTYNDSGNIDLYCTAVEGTKYDWVNYSISMNERYHFGCIWDFEGGSIQMYLNGTSVDNDTSLVIGTDLSSHSGNIAYQTTDADPDNHLGNTMDNSSLGITQDFSMWGVSDRGNITGADMEHIYDIGMQTYWTEIVNFNYLEEQSMWMWADLDNCDPDDDSILSPGVNITSYCEGCLWS